MWFNVNVMQLLWGGADYRDVSLDYLWISDTSSLLPTMTLLASLRLARSHTWSPKSLYLSNQTVRNAQSLFEDEARKNHKGIFLYISVECDGAVAEL